MKPALDTLETPKVLAARIVAKATAQVARTRETHFGFIFAMFESLIEDVIVDDRRVIAKALLADADAAREVEETRDAAQDAILSTMVKYDDECRRLSKALKEALDGWEEWRAATGLRESETILRLRDALTPFPVPAQLARHRALEAAAREVTRPDRHIDAIARLRAVLEGPR